MDFSKLPDKIITSRRQLETTDENAVVKWAEGQGILVTKMTAIGRRGFMDRCFWLSGGRPLYIEFKSPGKSLRKLQQYWFNKLRKLGYDVEAHDNKEDAINAITKRLDLCREICDASEGAAGTRKDGDAKTTSRTTKKLK